MFFNKNKKIKALGNPIDDSKPIITICDLNEELCIALANQFSSVNQVEVIKGDLFSIKSDSIVSPANSFGDMSGGIDKKIDEHYKNEAQGKVMWEIREKYLGELPVGSTLILKMNVGKYPNLIIAPTMRVPGILRKDSINVYLAMRGILSQVLNHNEGKKTKIKKILMPGLGSGVGGMNYQESAMQMYIAYKNIFEEEWKNVIHPSLAPYVLRK